MLTYLSIFVSDNLQIDSEKFSTLKRLTVLNISYYYSFGSLENKYFSELLSPQAFFGLRNLKKLNLKNNILIDFDFSKLEYYCNIDKNNLVSNLIIKLKNVLRRSKDSKIGLELERVKDDAFIKDESIDMSFQW